MGGQLISRILYNLADVIKHILFNIIMILYDFISKLQYLHHEIKHIFKKILYILNLYIVPFPTEKHYLLYNSTHTHQHLSDLTLELKERKILSNQIIFENPMSHTSHKVSPFQHVPEAQTQILPPDLPCHLPP